MPEKWVSILLLLHLCCFGCGSSGKVLVWPLEFSHWINMKTILQELVQRGHNISVLVSSNTLFIDTTDSSGLNYEVYPMPTTKEEDLSKMETFMNEMIYQDDSVPSWKTIWNFHELMGKVTLEFRDMCRSIVSNQILMEKLRKAGYDVMFSDIAFPCGDLIAEMLEISQIHSLRWSLGNTYERYCGGLPTLPSYVPVPLGRLTDKMSFLERVKNTLLYLLSDFYFYSHVTVWEEFYSEVLDFHLVNLNTEQHKQNVQIYSIISEKWVSILLLLNICCFNFLSSEKVLVWPIENSHWINLKIILDELIQRGHVVTVLVPSVRFLIDPTASSELNYEIFPILYEKEEMQNFLENNLKKLIHEIPNIPYWKAIIKFYEQKISVNQLMKSLCKRAIFNQKFMQKLQETGYNLMILDDLFLCGSLIAKKLQLPFMHRLQYSLGNNLEKYCARLPLPLSYVPIPLGRLTEKMTFMERVKNMMLSFLFDFGFQSLDKEWKRLFTEALGKTDCFQKGFVLSNIAFCSV